MHIAVIICAAGRSRRFAGGLDLLDAERSKLDEDLGGRPVLQRAVELFTHEPRVRHIIVAGPHDDERFGAFMLRHGDRLGLLGATPCRGGAEHRYETVAAALKHIPADATHIAVHDAARPVTSAALIECLFDAAARHAAVIPAVSVADTLKRTGEARKDDAGDPLAAILGASGAASTVRPVIETIDRRALVAVQTPQVFAADLLRRAYQQPDLASTDDAQLVERLGEEVVCVEGDPLNIKITTQADVRLARVIGNFPPPKERPSLHKF